jgi:hypothetical protein
VVRREKPGALFTHDGSFAQPARRARHPVCNMIVILEGLDLPAPLTIDDLPRWRNGGADARALTPDGYFGAPNPVDPDLWRHYDETARIMGRALARNGAG